MSFKRAFVILALLLSLTACGFQPLYSKNNAKGDFDQIAIANIPDRSGQYLRNLLMDRFYTQGRPSNPRYTLEVTNLKEDSIDLDITKTSSSTRAQLRMDATITLRDNATQAVLLEQPLLAITSYDILSSQFTTRVSEQSTRENALHDLARQIEMRLALYLRTQQIP